MARPSPQDDPLSWLTPREREAIERLVKDEVQKALREKREGAGLDQ